MQRLPTYGIEVFLTIVREGSMRAAADALGVGASAVTLQLKSLEERLGIELFFRTTRSVALTDAGKVLFEAAAPAHRDLIYAIKKTREMAQSTTGTLRLSLSRGAYIGALAPALKEFLAENPGINLDLSWNEELVDIVRDGFHGGIRMGDVLSPDMIAVRITPTVKSAFFAAPNYLKVHGVPKCPRDLLHHQCIRHRHLTSSTMHQWWVTQDGQDKLIDPPARLIFDSAAGVIEAARDGHGVGWSMKAAMKDYLKTGELQTVLEPYAKDLSPFYIYYPMQNKRVECLKVLVEFLKDRSKKHPGN
ncbi:LysR family transcriptional regulator [Roseibium sediminicola]|uniref:LysR family transcriptional regulator n=1 Tax=Roseibium sediminicola TaxID=2933272 RepID=A0ABT0GZT5_9HYPH|nr:LysR family transcriptional regulator [Roseibium sp. CAU 1639]MCK7614949.1 LysR family transcriptional regulator [Roseibium sp. CAU 1639]